MVAIANEIADAGGQAIYVSTDVRRREDMVALVELAKERFGRLDVLVSNAGVGPISPLDDLRVDEWETIIDTNIKGLLYGVATALPVFREQQTGHFVNVASTAARLQVEGSRSPSDQRSPHKGGYRPYGRRQWNARKAAYSGRSGSR